MGVEYDPPQSKAGKKKSVSYPCIKHEQRDFVKDCTTVLIARSETPELIQVAICRVCSTLSQKPNLSIYVGSLVTRYRKS